MVTGKIIQRTIGSDGQVTGTYDNNPFLNSIIYDVEFPDGQVKEYAANFIAENMLTQVDSDGMSTTSSEFGHVEGKEEFPAKMPEPRGHGFIMRQKWMQIMHQIQFQGDQDQDF